jgi:hypothetical protein
MHGVAERFRLDVNASRSSAAEILGCRRVAMAPEAIVGRHLSTSDSGSKQSGTEQNVSQHETHRFSPAPVR